jgi:hypothetical protein
MKFIFDERSLNAQAVDLPIAGVTNLLFLLHASRHSGIAINIAVHARPGGGR